MPAIEPDQSRNVAPAPIAAYLLQGQFQFFHFTLLSAHEAHQAPLLAPATLDGTLTRSPGAVQTFITAWF